MQSGREESSQFVLLLRLALKNLLNRCHHAVTEARHSQRLHKYAPCRKSLVNTSLAILSFCSNRPIFCSYSRLVWVPKGVLLGTATAALFNHWINSVKEMNVVNIYMHLHLNLSEFFRFRSDNKKYNHQYKLFLLGCSSSARYNFLVTVQHGCDMA